MRKDVIDYDVNYLSIPDEDEYDNYSLCMSKRRLSYTDIEIDDSTCRLETTNQTDVQAVHTSELHSITTRIAATTEPVRSLPSGSGSSDIIVIASSDHSNSLYDSTSGSSDIIPTTSFDRNSSTNGIRHHRDRIRDEIYKWFGDRVRLIDHEVETNMLNVLSDERLFGNIDVCREIRRACTWELANPSKRKQSDELRQFLISWMDRASAKAPDKPLQTSSANDVERLEKFIARNWETDVDWCTRTVNALLSSGQDVPPRIMTWLQRCEKKGNMAISSRCIDWMSVPMSSIYPREMFERDLTPVTADERDDYMRQLDEILRRRYEARTNIYANPDGLQSSLGDGADTGDQGRLEVDRPDVSQDVTGDEGRLQNGQEDLEDW